MCRKLSLAIIDCIMRIGRLVENAFKPVSDFYFQRRATVGAYWVGYTSECTIKPASRPRTLTLLLWDLSQYLKNQSLSVDNGYLL